MRKLFSLFLLWVLMFSCREENNLLYSCDPVLNEIITAHLQEYATYTVNQISAYSFPVQQAVFRTYSSQKKREIWMEKINYLLRNENYSTKEYDHMSKLLNVLSENYFDPDTIKATATHRNIFFADWEDYAADSLGWNKSYVIFAVYRLYVNYQEYEKEVNELAYLRSEATADGEGEEEVPCNCGGSMDCVNGRMCVDGMCAATSIGCGFFMISSCTGLCN